MSNQDEEFSGEEFSGEEEEEEEFSGEEEGEWGEEEEEEDEEEEEEEEGKRTWMKAMRLAGGIRTVATSPYCPKTSRRHASSCVASKPPTHNVVTVGSAGVSSFRLAAEGPS